MKLIFQVVALTALLIAPVWGEEQPPFVAPPISVPVGYSIELIAAPPLVSHPMMASFDDRGRLYVAETDGQNLERKDLEAQLPNYITQLEDTDGDGVFDKSTRYADKLTFPQGALWHDGWLYVGSSGAVWRFRDADDDGYAEEREKLLGDFGYIGNAADIHGCFLHPSGRIYFVQGRHGHEISDENGKVISSSKAGGVFSIRPDGSDFRRHATGGFDNPVELIFTDEGDALGTVNLFHSRPRNDCLVHWVEGGLYPREDFVRAWDEFISTGELLPPSFDFGHVAVSGLCRSRRDGGVYVTLFNTHEVRRLELARNGSTYTATQEKFLESTHPDFHPTDVLEDAEGNLVVIDTGGWFRIGCPTSQVAKPHVKGAIYRVRGIPQAATVTGPTAMDELWAAIRAGGDVASEAVWHGLNARDYSLRHAAAHGAGLIGSPRYIERLGTMVIHDEPGVRRQAATALGLIGNAAGIPSLLDALTKTNDRFIDHAIVYALIRIGDADATRAGLAHKNPAVRRGALVALDRMGTGNLNPADVMAAFDSPDAEQRKAATEILIKQPQWSAQAAELLNDLLAKDPLGESDAGIARGTLEALAGRPPVANAIAERLRDPKTPRAAKMLILDVLATHGPAKPTEALSGALSDTLWSSDSAVLRLAIAATTRVTTDAMDDRLADIASDETCEPTTRIGALGSLAARGRQPGDAGFDLLLSRLGSSHSLLDRRDAARVVATAPLSASQLTALIEPVRSAGPIELPLLLAAFEKAENPIPGEALFRALAQSPGLPALESRRVTELAKKAAPAADTEARGVLDRIRADEAGRGERIAELQRSLAAHGDVERGRKVFFSNATCFVCHRVGGEGGLIGPDLSSIGNIRTQRDLLESIAFPNASFARGYEPMSAVLKDGRTLFGRIERETQDRVIFVDPQGIAYDLPRGEIKNLHGATVSLMPAGLERLLTPQELTDLLAFLSALK